ncbi:hypothetical protein VCHA53O466_40280 [Vibrio chagasii]|nr:hypothetical protein VCHA53O466_40280 [Vibrio chagasii]
MDAMTKNTGIGRLLDRLSQNNPSGDLPQGEDEGLFGKLLGEKNDAVDPKQPLDDNNSISSNQQSTLGFPLDVSLQSTRHSHQNNALNPRDVSLKDVSVKASSELDIKTDSLRVAISDVPRASKESSGEIKGGIGIESWSTEVKREAKTDVVSPLNEVKNPISSELSDVKVSTKLTVEDGLQVQTEVRSDKSSGEFVRTEVKTTISTVNKFEADLRQLVQEQQIKTETITKNEIRISLRPLHLGEVKVEISREAEAIRVNIVSSTEEAKHHLSNQKESIAQALSEDMSGNVDVDVNLGGDKDERPREENNASSGTNNSEFDSQQSLDVLYEKVIKDNMSVINIP